MNIVVTSPSFSKNRILKREIKTCFPDSVFNEKGRHLTGEELASFLHDADGAIIGLEPIDSDLLNKCRRLKIIAKYGVGIDNIDVEACTARNIIIKWTQGVNSLSVAELTLGFMLALTHNMQRTCRALKNGHWEKQGGCMLSSKTVGIIGVGNIGKQVVRLLKPFSCRIIVNDIINQDDYYRENSLEHVDKKTIFSQSDILTIHTPLTDLTRNMVNGESLALMKLHAYLVNTARGRIVDEQALKHVLQHRLIAGAALDVYHDEPPSDPALISCDNLLCTPHIGGNAAEAVLAMGKSAINHLKEFYYG